MDTRALARFCLWLVLTVLAAVLAARTLPDVSETWAQSSVPTYTPTPSPQTPTDTPTPSAPTDTPIPPTPTNTPTPLPQPPQILFGLTIYPLEGVVQTGDPIDVDTIFAVTPGTDQYLVNWNWGDGTVSSCLTESEECEVSWGIFQWLGCPGDPVGDCPEEDMVPYYSYGGEVIRRHTYSEPGVYTVHVVVWDRFAQFDTAFYEFVIVYDSDGGFVTGGGWIDSQLGSYKPDNDLTGKASFGFVSKYQKGANQPTGNTQFQFHVADLNFHSDSYQWLVVNQAGTNAQFKGSGTINGARAPSGENYKFMIWAHDGEPDTFRIKIWYEDEDPFTDVIVYDNGFDQAIGGGSIEVHAAKEK